ncbi:TetR/AcrR family transcriptional regulator [Aureimonas sp. Leaf454]|uniref:TetR/AcrR family transcriptional regulator n=1 Tax=Aureimonas sp. Leaf454 TaxID=1736381 RepID=UPI000ACB4732|nr:TetR/AcrR family transcriptional regulator [Aureimonas sp. Leaf454]
MSYSATVTPQGPGSSNAQDARRKQILAAARACFARSGFHGASMGQICSEAAMSPGALYRYFPSKDSIIEAIAEEERIGAGECMEIFFGKGSLVDRLVLSAMDYLEKSIAEATGGLMIEIVSESIRNTAIGERFHAIESDVRSTIRAALDEAQKTGEIGADVDLDIALVMLLAVGDGLVMRLQLERRVDLGAMEPYLRRMIAAILAGAERAS